MCLLMKRSSLWFTFLFSFVFLCPLNESLLPPKPQISHIHSFKFSYSHIYAGKGWRQEEKGATEDKTVGRHHWLNGRWVWANSRRERKTGKPGVVQFMQSPRVGHDLVTEWQQQLHLKTDEFDFHNILINIAKISFQHAINIKLLMK